MSFGVRDNTAVEPHPPGSRPGNGSNDAPFRTISRRTQSPKKLFHPRESHDVKLSLPTPAVALNSGYESKLAY